MLNRRSADSPVMWTVHEGLSLIAFVREEVFVDVYLLLTLNRVQTLSLQQTHGSDVSIACVAFGGSAVLLLAVLTSRGSLELFKANDEGVLTTMNRLPPNALCSPNALLGVEWVSNMEGDFVLTWSRERVTLQSATTGNEVLSFAAPSGGVSRAIPARRHLLLLAADEASVSILSQKTGGSGVDKAGGLRTKHVWIRRGEEVRIVADEDAVRRTVVDVTAGGGVRDVVCRVEGSRTIAAVMDKCGWLHVLGETGEKETLQSWVVELSVDIMHTLHSQTAAGCLQSQTAGSARLLLAWSLVPHVDKRQQSFVLSASTRSEHSLSVVGSTTNSAAAAGPLTSLLLDPASFRGSHKAVDEFDSSPWSVYVAAQDWLGRVLEIRFDAGLSSDPRLAVDVKIASWALDSGVQRLPIPLLIPLPVMSEDRPVFVSHPSVGCLRLASRPKPLKRRASSFFFSGPRVQSLPQAVPEISVKQDLVFTLDPDKAGLLRLFHCTSPAGLDAPVSVLGEISSAVFLASAEAEELDTDPFSPFSASVKPAACLAFCSAAPALERAPTVSFGHVFLPATPWTRDAVRLCGEVELLPPPNRRSGRVALLRAFREGRQLVAVVETSASSFQLVSLAPQAGEWQVSRRVELVLSGGGGAVWDVAPVEYLEEKLVALCTSDDGSCVRVFVEAMRQCGRTVRRTAATVVGAAVSAEAVGVCWSDGLVQIFRDPVFRLELVFEANLRKTVTTDLPSLGLQFAMQGCVLASREFVAVRSRDEVQGERWQLFPRQTAAAALAVTSSGVFVWREDGDVAAEVLERRVVEAVASNNSFGASDAVVAEYLELYGVSGTGAGNADVEEERALDVPGVQYMRELRFGAPGITPGRRRPESERRLLVGWASMSTCHSYLLEKTLPTREAASWTRVAEVACWVREGKVVELAERLYKEAIGRYKTSKSAEELEQMSIWLSVAGKQALLSSLYKQHGNLQSDAKSSRVGEFLGLDFSREENKSKAMKNAVELLRQKRYILATSVFILADLLEEAVDVCCRCLGDRSLAVFALKGVQADVKNVQRSERARLLLDQVLAEGADSVWLQVVSLWKHRDFHGVLDVFKTAVEKTCVCHSFFAYLLKQIKILDPSLQLQLQLQDFNAELDRLRIQTARSLVCRRLGRVAERLPELRDALEAEELTQLRCTINKVYW